MNSTPPWSRLRWNQPDSRTSRRCRLPQRAAGMGAIGVHSRPGFSVCGLRPERGKRMRGCLCQGEPAPDPLEWRHGTNSGETRRATRPRAATRMTTAEATLGALLAHGLDTIYALPGVHNDDFFDALAKRHSREAPQTSAWSTPATSKAPPTWRSAPRWRRQSRRPIAWCPGRACSTRRRLCSPPMG